MMSEKGEAQQTTREVNLLELTAAQQDRLPKLYPSLPPTAPDKDLLANSLPPSSADNGTPLTTSSSLERPPSSPELPSLNLPPLPPIPSYIDLSSLPPSITSEPILSQLQIEREPFRQNRPRQLPLPPEINSGLIGQLPVPPDLQINRSRTPQLPLATDLQAYRPPGVNLNSPFSQLPQVEPSVLSPQQFPEQSGRSEFEGLPVASAPRHLGPLPEKIPQQAIDELRRLQAQNKARNLEGTVAASIPTGTTVELMPQAEAQRAIASAPKPKIPQQAIDELQQLQAEQQPGTEAATELGLSSIPSGAFTVPEKSAAAPVHGQSETARSLPRKIPQQALDELRRLQALHRAELLASNDSSEEAATDQIVASSGGTTEVEAVKNSEEEAATSQTVASPQGATAESQQETVAAKPMVSAPEATPTAEVQTVASPQGATAASQQETVAAKPMVSAPEAMPTAEVAKIPERAIATLRELQQKFAYNPAGTTPAEALASLQAWLETSKKAASNPELLWEPKRITASYPDAACRYGLDKNANDATVGVLVDPEGKISSQPETIESTGYALLNDIALEAARSYDFAASGEYKAYLLEIKFSHSDSCVGIAASGQ